VGTDKGDRVRAQVSGIASYPPSQNGPEYRVRSDRHHALGVPLVYEYWPSGGSDGPEYRVRSALGARRLVYEYWPSGGGDCG